MDSLEYQLTIKSANQKVDDYSLTCRSSWTVARLKQHISETHINKPSVGDQRLIYAGNLLKDSLTLKQVFFRDSLCTELTNASKTDFTIHLVCSTSAQRSQTITSASARASTSNATGPNQATGQTRTHQATATSATSNAIPPVPNVSNGATNGQSIPGSSNSAAPAATSPGQTGRTDQFIPSSLASAATSNSRAYETAQALLRIGPMSQQQAIFQQLANIFAAELVRNLSMNSGFASSSPDATNNITTEQSSLQVSSTLNSSMDGQVLNLPAGPATIAAESTPSMAAATQANGNNLAAPSMFARMREDLHELDMMLRQRHNPHGENNANGPGVGHQDQAAAAPVAGPQVQQAPMPQAPIMDQPVPAQPIDPEPALQHDVIDWVYYSIRALIFMVALYIHASFFRLLFIVGLMALAYFFSRRSARRQNQAQPQAAPRPAAAPAAPAAPEHRDPPGVADQDQVENNEERNRSGELRQRRAGVVEGQARDDGDRINNNGNQQVDGLQRPDIPAETGEAAQRRVSFLKLCYLVVTDFLVSFVPE